jgi:transposase InsO family protein
LSAACRILGVSVRTIQRWRLEDGGEDGRQGPRTEPGTKLSEAERQVVLDVATSPEFRDLSPKQIVPTLADRCIYLASEATVYRILREAKLMAHREPSRPPSPKPRELVAAGPNQVYTWDITYLRSPVRGEFFYLSMFVDLFSRKIVGWRVDEVESMDHAAELIRRICWKEGIEPGTVTLHSDNGGPMKGSTMLATLQRLGVVPSFSRPRVSDDNPYSEALFRTLKYRSGYPQGPFADIEAARDWVAAFVDWYNHCHLHSSIQFVTPADRHAGRDVEILAQRKAVYEAARAKKPERWSGSTRDWTPVAEVVLNPGPAASEQLKKSKKRAAA